MGSLNERSATHDRRATVPAAVRAVAAALIAGGCGGGGETPEVGVGATATAPLGTTVDRVLRIAEGRGLYVLCTGTGSRTLILEGGDEDTSDSYAFAESRLAQATRTCVYDRAPQLTWWKTMACFPVRSAYCSSRAGVPEVTRGWLGRTGSATSVDVSAVLRREHRDSPRILIDGVEDPVGAAARGPASRELALQRLANPPRRFEEVAGEELDDGSGDPLGQVLGDGPRRWSRDPELIALRACGHESAPASRHDFAQARLVDDVALRDGGLALTQAFHRLGI